MRVASGELPPWPDGVPLVRTFGRSALCRVLCTSCWCALGLNLVAVIVSTVLRVGFVSERTLVVVDCGRFGFNWIPYEPNYVQAAIRRDLPMGLQARRIRSWRLSDYFGRPTFGNTGTNIPLLYLAGILLCLAVLLSRLRNRARVDRCKTNCMQCGYDLAGNRSGRCPECGALSLQLSGPSRPPA